jgi:hypothetical protein
MISPELMTAHSAEMEQGYSSLARGELASAFQCSSVLIFSASAALAYMLVLTWRC